MGPRKTTSSQFCYPILIVHCVSSNIGLLYILVDSVTGLLFSASTDTGSYDVKFIAWGRAFSYPRRQDAATFRSRTGAFRKLTKKLADLVFITAPNLVPPLPDAEDQTTEQFGWWFSTNDDSFHAQDYSDQCKGYEQSLEVVRTAFREQGPFDGVLGFSQGASFLSLMCALLQRQGPDSGFKFDFAVLVAGFKSRSSQHSDLYATDTPASLPTLHVFGDTDKVIEKEMSEDLLQYFVDPAILTHPGGHFIPASAQQKKIYVDFFTKMKERKNAAINS
ncbi:hypothetical protein CAPTEDRAFT_223070 [Capitella teleta]|uniref:Serine hydrolase domain-containing protein n=1 Tax=Capitella teleta TaxID=283909 RepID=R7TZ49_CAPTE|nr:hypothetical protein CAPTEDRAFT_223070 [Capitella teleta]|eukprot:ELT98892.1 hypothetical protein CAPTEDRAFT_223070 [Capitella teleta]